MEPAGRQAAGACEHLAGGPSEPWCSGLTACRPVVAAAPLLACLLLSLCAGEMERFSAFYAGTGTAAQRLPVSGRPTACGTRAPPPRRSLGDTGSRSRCSPPRLSVGCIVRLDEVQTERRAAGTGDNGTDAPTARPTSTPSVRRTTWPMLRPSVEASVRVATDSPDRRIRRPSECRNGCPAGRRSG